MKGSTGGETGQAGKWPGRKITAKEVQEEKQGRPKAARVEK